MEHISTTIRMATSGDADALLAIYAPYVEHTAITFEYKTPTREEFKKRISRTLERYPYLAAEQDGQIAGYAYASAFHERAAYRWAAEVTVYVDQNARRAGTGSLLYEALEHILKKQHVLNVNACIAYPNPASIAFHKRMGYKTAAHFTKCGYKLGQWWDMIWMEKLLSPHQAAPAPFVPLNELPAKDSSPVPGQPART